MGAAIVGEAVIRAERPSADTDQIAGICSIIGYAVIAQRALWKQGAEDTASSLPITRRWLATLNVCVADRAQRLIDACYRFTGIPQAGIAMWIRVCDRSS